MCGFGFFFDTLFVDLDCISCRFGLHFGTLLAGLGFFPSVLAPGALPERSWKPSTTPVGFLMICCWIFTSNSMHMSYTLHATRWISDDLVLDFHIEFSAYVIQFKTCTVSRSLILLPCPCFCAAQRSAARCNSCALLSSKTTCSGCLEYISSSISGSLEWRWSCGPRARRHLRSRPLDGSRLNQK